MALKERTNFGWIPDLPDVRDKLLFSGAAPPEANLPRKVDLTVRHKFTVMDQGMIGSCVAHAVASAIEFAQAMRPNDPAVPDFLEADRKFPVSRLFLYYEARTAIGMESIDSGCYIRDALRVAYNVGVPRESGWRYVEEEYSTKPPRRSYKYAPYHKITSYRSVGVNVEQVKAALALGLPVVIGVSVFSSFFHSGGDIPFPTATDDYLGGHAILLVGYDDDAKRFKFLNSWGTGWGHAGYGTLPYAYVGNPRLGADYWVMTDELYKERMPAAPQLIP